MLTRNKFLKYSRTLSIKSYQDIKENGDKIEKDEISRERYHVHYVGVSIL